MVPTFCLRHAAHALTFLDIPGILPSACAPFVELVRCGFGGAFAIRGGSSKEGRLVFLGESTCPGEVYECGDTEEAARCKPGTGRGEGIFASCQLRFDMM